MPVQKLHGHGDIIEINLYFYSIHVYNEKGNLIRSDDGSVELDKIIKTNEDFRQAKKFIESEIGFAEGELINFISFNRI